MKTNRYTIEYQIEITESTNVVIETFKRIDGLSINDILFENEIWDGPLTGLCVWNGDKYYYHSIEQHNQEYDLKRNPRPYFLIRLSNEQLLNHESLHNEFLRCVGQQDQVQWDRYFEACKKYPNQIITRDQILGWFFWVEEENKR